MLYPVLRQNSVRRQVIDLSALVGRRSRLNGHSPAPPASTVLRQNPVRSLDRPPQCLGLEMLETGPRPESASPWAGPVETRLSGAPRTIPKNDASSRR